MTACPLCGARTVWNADGGNCYTCDRRVDALVQADYRALASMGLADGNRYTGKPAWVA